MIFWVFVFFRGEIVFFSKSPPGNTGGEA